MGPTLLSFLSSVKVKDIIDIIIISFLVYKILILLKGTRAAYMLITIMLIVILLGFSEWLGLQVTSWVLNNLSGYLLIVLVVIFQPEIRRALAFIGESNFFEKKVPLNSSILDILVRSTNILANRQLGALIVIERNTKLNPYFSAGQYIDSEISKDIIISLFIPYSPLHDGAVIISGSRLAYAATILPLTEKEDLPSDFGTRHRAAIGITEETDAVAIVVSEERGAISVAHNGKIYSDLDANSLTDILESIFRTTIRSNG